MTHNLIKRCATVMQCNYRDRCRHSHASIQGNVQFFVPTDTGEQCHHYIPHFKPWGEGPDNDND